MTVLLDTNVLSELRKQRPEPAVSDWLGAIDITDVRLSVVTLGELRRGVEQVRPHDASQADAIEGWLAEVLATWTDQLVGIDAAVADMWGRLNAIRTRPVIDGMLAATALVHGWALITRNVRDFEDTGVEVYDPWTFGT